MDYRLIENPDLNKPGAAAGQLPDMPADPFKAN